MQNTPKRSAWNYLWIIVGFGVIGVFLFFIGHWTYYAFKYSYDKLDPAIYNNDFDLVHKILNRMSKDSEYTKKEFHFFSKNGPSEYDKQCKKAFTAEIIYLIKQGAIDRIENVASLYPEGRDQLPEIIMQQSANIYKNFDNIDESSMIMLCKYLPPSSVTANYVTRGPSSIELISFLRKIPYETNSPITGHVELPEILEKNEEFIKETNKYNEAIDVALEYGLSTNNKDLCNQILSLYKKNIKQVQTKRHTFSYDEYDVDYVDYQRERAKRRIAEKF